MAINRLTISGYGQIELNRVAFPITGRVVADLPLNASFTTSAPAENGMILAVDYPGAKVKLPNLSTDTILGLHYSPEKEYDPNLAGLKNFKLTAGGFYPRLGILAVGDRFTTNCICYDTADYADEATAIAALANAATTPVYGKPSTSGAIQIDTALAGTEKVGLQVVEKTTMPDGSIGVKFVVIAAQ